MNKTFLFLLIILLFNFAKAEDEKLKDPTEPNNYATSKFQLTAIGIVNNIKYCVINDQIMQEGAKIQDYVISQIDTDKIILIDENKKLIELTIN